MRSEVHFFSNSSVHTSVRCHDVCHFMWTLNGKRVTDSRFTIPLSSPIPVSFLLRVALIFPRENGQVKKI